MLAVTTASAQVIKSTDSGRTWRPVEFPAGDYQIVDFQAPRQSNLYVLAADTPRDAYGRGYSVLMSSDAGETWQALNALRVARARFAALAVLPGDPDTLYVIAERESSDWGAIRLQRSTDAGRSAQDVSSTYVGYPFVPSIWPGAYLAADPRAPSRLFLGPRCWHCGDSAGPALSHTQDDGRTWQETVWGLTSQVFTHHPDPSIVYALVARESYGSMASLMKSGNSGASWDEKRRDLNTVAFHPVEPDVVVANDVDGNILVTVDGGDNWTSTAQLYVRFRRIDIHALKPNLVFAQPHDFPGLLFRSDDLGRTWQVIDTGRPGFSFYVDPRDSELVYGVLDSHP